MSPDELCVAGLARGTFTRLCLFIRWLTDKHLGTGVSDSLREEDVPLESMLFPWDCREPLVLGDKQLWSSAVPWLSAGTLSSTDPSSFTFKVLDSAPLPPVQYPIKKEEMANAPPPRPGSWSSSSQVRASVHVAVFRSPSYSLHVVVWT